LRLKNDFIVKFRERKTEEMFPAYADCVSQKTTDVEMKEENKDEDSGESN
jgi:hypothetical protein